MCSPSLAAKVDWGRRRLALLEISSCDTPDRSTLEPPGGAPTQAPSQAMAKATYLKCFKNYLLSRTRHTRKMYVRLRVGRALAVTGGFVELVHIVRDLKHAPDDQIPCERGTQNARVQAPGFSFSAGNPFDESRVFVYHLRHLYFHRRSTTSRLQLTRFRLDSDI